MESDIDLPFVTHQQKHWALFKERNDREREVPNELSADVFHQQPTCMYRFILYFEASGKEAQKQKKQRECGKNDQKQF